MVCHGWKYISVLTISKCSNLEQVNEYFVNHSRSVSVVSFDGRWRLRKPLFSVAPRPQFMQVLRFASSSTDDSGRAPALDKNTLNFAALRKLCKDTWDCGG